MQETRKRVRNQTITGRLERVNICAGEAKTPSQINPLKSHHRLVRPIASCRLLNAHAGLLVHTQWELDLCPDSCTHTQTQIPWPRLMASSHHAKHLLGVNPQQKLGSCVCVCVCLCVWVCGREEEKRKRVWEVRVGVCTHIPVDGGKECMAFDLFHAVGPGP